MATKESALSLTVEDLLIMSKASNYHNWLLNQFDGYIGNRVIDLGAGIGTYTDMLTNRQLVVAVEREHECIKYLECRFNNYGNVFVFQSDIETESLHSLKFCEIDTIICFNVLEHIEDDSLLLKRLNYLLEPEGRLLLIVPAYQALYGSIDKAVGHHRRYSKKELIGKVTESGFVIEKAFRMNSLAVPGWFWINRILKKNEQSQKMVSAYDKHVIPALSKLEKLIPPPIGLSLAVVGRKV